MRHAPALIAALALLLAAPSSADATFAVLPDNAPGTLLTETAIILPIAAERRQHLVLRTTLRTDAPNLALLIPTPAPAEVTTAPALAFTQLDALIQPRVIEDAEELAGLKCTLLCFELTAPPTDSIVKELEPPALRTPETPTRIDLAATFPAHNTDVIAAWLHLRGLTLTSPQRDALLRLPPTWSIAAVALNQLDDTDQDGVQATLPLHLTYSVDHPTALLPDDHALDLHILAPGPVRLGDSDAPSPGVHLYRAAPFPAHRSVFGEFLPQKPLAQATWLTTFHVDPESPTHGPLLLSPANLPSPLEPPPIHRTKQNRIPIPMECALIAVFIAVAIWSWRKRME